MPWLQLEHHDIRGNTARMNLTQVGLVPAEPTTSLAGGFTDFTAAAFAEALAMAEEADADLRGAGSPNPQHAICYMKQCSNGETSFKSMLLYLYVSTFKG